MEGNSGSYGGLAPHKLVISDIKTCGCRHWHIDSTYKPFLYVSIHDVCGGAVGSPSPWGLGLWVAPTAGSSIATTP